MCFIANIERAHFSMNFTWTNLLGGDKKFPNFKVEVSLENVAAKCKIVVEIVDWRKFSLSEDRK